MNKKLMVLLGVLLCGALTQTSNAWHRWGWGGGYWGGPYWGAPYYDPYYPAGAFVGATTGLIGTAIVASEARRAREAELRRLELEYQRSGVYNRASERRIQALEDEIAELKAREAAK